MIKVAGKKIAQRIIDELKKQPQPEKVLAAILTGGDPASFSFLKQKEKVAEELGVKFELRQLGESISQEELENKVKDISDDLSIGGVIVQLPLPSKFNRDKVLAQLDLAKDVDNLTGKALVGSPAVSVVRDVLKKVGWLDDKEVFFKDLNIAIVGQGFLIGQPVVRWVEEKDLYYKIADIDTKDLKGFLADVDLVISGVGKKNLIDPAWLKEGAGVIDFGYPADLGKGDYQHLSFYTPTPGGTGPILVAELFRNFYELNK